YKLSSEEFPAPELVRLARRGGGERFLKYIEAGYDHICIHQIGPNQEAVMDFYGREIFPKIDGISKGKRAASGKRFRCMMDSHGARTANDKHTTFIENLT